MKQTLLFPLAHVFSERTIVSFTTSEKNEYTLFTARKISTTIYFILKLQNKLAASLGVKKSLDKAYQTRTQKTSTPFSSGIHTAVKGLQYKFQVQWKGPSYAL